MIRKDQRYLMMIAVGGDSVTIAASAQAVSHQNPCTMLLLTRLLHQSSKQWSRSFEPAIKD
jgi:hypothetical protein